MSIYPLSCSSLDQLFINSTSINSGLAWMKRSMSANNQQHQNPNAIDKLQDDLDHLFNEWNSIHIVLESVRNAFTVNQNLSEEHLDQIDKELSIAYDDLMAQVRHLNRRLNKMSLEVNQALFKLPPSTPTPSPNTH